MDTRAQRDLTLIHDHIAADSATAAGRFAERLHEAGNRLSDFPEAGRAEGASRVLVTVRPYIIRYRIRPEGVVIIGISHGRQRRSKGSGGTL